MENKKKISFSGIQPSGTIHIGNYLGAIKQWVKMQDEVDESIYCIVDLHAITTITDKTENDNLKLNILQTAAMYVACGIDPEKASIFVQSTRPEHAEMTWILNCYTFMGQLLRMTQYKSKAKLVDYQNIENELRKVAPQDNDEIREVINNDNVTKEMVLQTANETMVNTASHFIKNNFINPLKNTSVGLFDYPVLMASDILLYQSTDVPVGVDQKQHVELSRDIAERVNKRYGDVFTIPKPNINSSSARIMSLDDPTKKMSKSDTSDAGYIAMTDSADDIKRKIKRAVTDSGSEIKSGEDKPALTNLLNIYSEFSGKSVQDIEIEFNGKGYGDFKKSLAEVIVEGLKPIQEKYQNLMNDKESLKAVLKAGSEKIAPVAQKTLNDLKEKIGLGL